MQVPEFSPAKMKLIKQVSFGRKRRTRVPEATNCRSKSETPKTCDVYNTNYYAKHLNQGNSLAGSLQEGEELLGLGLVLQ